MWSALSIAASIASVISIAMGILTALGERMIRATVAEESWNAWRRKDMSMLPKDLLVYLEKGDRTAEDLKNRANGDMVTATRSVMYSGLSAQMSGFYGQSFTNMLGAYQFQNLQRRP